MVISVSGVGFTSENLAILEEAIAAGARKVKYTDKEITYHSLDDMLRIRDLMRKQLGIVSGSGAVRYAETSKGLTS